MEDKPQDKSIACIECGGQMETGYVPDHSYGQWVHPSWVAGKPERHWIAGMKIKAPHRYPLTSWRCEDCGLLKFYAHRKHWNKVTD